MTIENYGKDMEEQKHRDSGIENTDENIENKYKRSLLWKPIMPNCSVDISNSEQIINTFKKNIGCKGMFFEELPEFDYAAITKDDIKNLNELKENFECKQLRIMDFDFIKKMKEIKLELEDLANVYLKIQSQNIDECRTRFLILLQNYIKYKKTELDRLSQIREKINFMIYKAENMWNELNILHAVANKK